MQNYYIPCTQQDRPHGSTKATEKSHTFLRRPSGQALRRIDSVGRNTQHNDWTTKGQIASLENSTVDLASPVDTVHASDIQNGCRRSSGGDHAGDAIVRLASSGTKLPSRPKSGSVSRPHQKQFPEKLSQSKQLPQATIQETAVRSRLAPRASVHDLELPQRVEALSCGKPASVVTVNSRCHARRRPCAESSSVPQPPKLKRDTDCTDAIVKLIVCFSTKLVHTIWSQSNATPRSTTGFNGAGVLPLRVFIQETLRRSKTSYSTLQVALFYLILLKPYVGSHYSTQDAGASQCRALQCGRRMFLTALILASKYLQDRNYSSRAWSKISGLPIAEINENERKYLNLIQYNLHMKKESFENWSKIVLTLCKVGEASMNQDITNGSQGSRASGLSSKTVSVDGDNPEIGSEQWWSQHLRRLSAELVGDSVQTEAFLASLTSTEPEPEAKTEPLMVSLQTPPSSPDAANEISSDSALTKMVPENTVESLKSKEAFEYPSSPASIASLPSRPSLSNLPTPLTTPRYHNTLPLPRGLCSSSMRCKASSQVLLGLEKHALNAANLEMCPPPKPRGTEGPHSISISSLMASPESMISDVSSYSTRSRSSSLSSNSSFWCPSSAQSSIDDYSARLPAFRKENTSLALSQRPVSVAQIPASYSFYHSVRPNMVSFDDEGIVVDRSVCAQMPLNHQNLAKLHDEGYGSDEYGYSDREKILAAQEGARVLAKLNGHEGSQANPCPAVVDMGCKSLSEGVQHFNAVKKQKRGRPSLSEDILHSNVRQFLMNDAPPVDVFGSPCGASKQDKEKEIQYPAKDWACSKRPVCNSMHTKRIALEQCIPSLNQASSVAAGYLRDITMVR